MKQILVFLQFGSITALILNGGLFQLDVVLLFQVLGLYLGFWSIKAIKMNNWSVYYSPNPDSTIESSGPYAIIRHPMYSALLLFFIPIALRSSTLFSYITLAILTLTLIVKIVYEESALKSKHPEYAEFMKKTKKRLIPFVW